MPTMIEQPCSLPPVPAASAVTASLYTVIGTPAGNLACISVTTSSPSAAQDMPASPRQTALTSAGRQREASRARSMARRSEARASTRPELFLGDRGNHRQQAEVNGGVGVEAVWKRRGSGHVRHQFDPLACEDPKTRRSRKVDHHAASFRCSSVHANNNASFADPGLHRCILTCVKGSTMNG